MSNISGLLMIVGGDDDRENFWNTASIFTRKLKRKHRIVILLEEYRNWKRWIGDHRRRWKSMGYEEIEFFLPQVRDDYTEERVIDLIMWADVIFIFGGDTRKYHRYYCTHSISKALRDGYNLYGKSIAGLSAGALLFPERAIIWGEEIQTRGKSPSLRVRANIIHSKDDGDHIFRMGQGIGLLDSVIVDVHFTEWGRYPRLAHALSTSKTSGSTLLGIGLDANAAAIIHPDGTARTLGCGSVVLMHLKNPAQGKRRAVLEMKRLRIGDRFRCQGKQRIAFKSI